MSAPLPPPAPEPPPPDPRDELERQLRRGPIKWLPFLAVYCGCLVVAGSLVIVLDDTGQNDLGWAMLMASGALGLGWAAGLRHGFRFGWTSAVSPVVHWVIDGAFSRREHVGERGLVGRWNQTAKRYGPRLGKVTVVGVVLTALATVALVFR